MRRSQFSGGLGGSKGRGPSLFAGKENFYEGKRGGNTRKGGSYYGGDRMGAEREMGA